VSVDFALAGEAISIASFKMFVTRFFNFFSASRSLRLTVRSSDSLGDVMTTAISLFVVFMSAPFFVVAGSEYAEEGADFRVPLYGVIDVDEWRRIGLVMTRDIRGIAVEGWRSGHCGRGLGIERRNTPQS
jgi:hypothetical protein